MKESKEWRAAYQRHYTAKVKADKERTRHDLGLDITSGLLPIERVTLSALESGLATIRFQIVAEVDADIIERGFRKLMIDIGAAKTPGTSPDAPRMTTKFKTLIDSLDLKVRAEEVGWKLKRSKQL